MGNETLEKINQYISKVDDLLNHLDDVIPTAVEEEEYRKYEILDDLKYADKKIQAIKDAKAELDLLNISIMKRSKWIIACIVNFKNIENLKGIVVIS